MKSRTASLKKLTAVWFFLTATLKKSTASQEKLTVTWK